MKELEQTVVVRDIEFKVSYSYEPEPPNSRYFPDEDYGLTIHSINVGCDDMLGLLSDEVLEEIEMVVREEIDGQECGE